MRLCFISLLLATAVGWISKTHAQETADSVEFSGRRWAVTGETIVEQYLGRTALRMGNGRAFLTDPQPFQDGTIEFDFATTGHRSFAGIFFRVQESRRDGEYFYLRPHQTNRFDALQYTPVDSGITAWQLYPEYNAEVAIPREEWVHVRLDISGDRLRVFVADGAEPVMTARLERGLTAGGIGFSSSALHGGGIDSPEGTLTAAISNLEINPRRASSAEAEMPSPAPGVITRWALSPAVAAPSGPEEGLPQDLMRRSDWTIATSDEAGRVNVSRYRAIPGDADGGLVLARVLLESESGGLEKLHFGFSDRVSIFLNGRIMYSADNSYLARSGRYLGVMTVDNDALYLPLVAGQNELILAVSETFGGWGIAGRLEDATGIRVAAAVP